MKNKLSIVCFTLLACLFATAVPAQDQLTNLPSVYIYTTNGQAVSSKTTYVTGTLTYIDGDSAADYSMSIRGRGNSTWGLAKKPYRIKFDESTKFLGKGYAKAKSWVLLANHADKALIRNAVTFNMGEYMGIPFNPATRFVDLTLNGTFLGNYQITDQVSVDAHRVHVKEQDYPLADTSNISGGYLVEVDGFGASEPVYFRTNKNIIITVKYPEDEEIDQTQIDYIHNYIQQFETALFSSNYADATQGYRAYVDSATLVDWYIASELSANVDCFWSTNIYKERDDPKLYFGPLWDYDIGYNNCNRTGDVTNKTMIDAGFGTALTKIWVNQMITDNWFNKAVNDRWKQLLANGLEAHMLYYIDSVATAIDRSQALNYTKWSISSRVYNEIYLYSTYAEYINQLKNFISDHIVYLTSAFASRVKDDPTPDPDPDPVNTDFTTDGNYYYIILNKGCGNAIDVTNQDSVPGSLIELYASTYDRMTQQWQIVPVGSYFQIINRQNGLALNDPTATPSTVGAQLTLAASDKTDTHQLWSIPAASTGYYNLINVYSGNAINNSGGGTQNGSRVVSYTNDSRNSTSNNRQWTIEAQEKVPEPEVVDTLLGITPASDVMALYKPQYVTPGDDHYVKPDGISQPLFDYRVAYDPQRELIRFVTDDTSNLEGVEATLYDSTGRLVCSFTAAKEQSVAALSTGIYLLRWSVNGNVKAVKFLKR